MTAALDRYVHFAAALPSGMAAYWLVRSAGLSSRRRAGVAFLLGMIATVVVVPAVRTATDVVAQVDGAWAQLLVFSFLAAALPEETVKWAALAFLGWTARGHIDRREWILLGTIVGLGFAATENTLFAYASGAGVGLLRTLTVLPCHAALGAVMGLLFSQRKAGRRSSWRLLAAWVVPMILHASYDALVLIAALSHLQRLRFASAILLTAVVVGTVATGIRGWERAAGPTRPRLPAEMRARRAGIFRLIGLILVAMATYISAGVLPRWIDQATTGSEQTAVRLLTIGSAAVALFGVGLYLRGRRLARRAALDSTSDGPRFHSGSTVERRNER